MRRIGLGSAIKVQVADSEQNVEARVMVSWKSRRKSLFVTSSLLAALVLGNVVPLNAAVTDLDERYRVETPSEDGWHGVNFDTTIKDWAQPSFLVASSKNPLEREAVLCNSLSDAACVKNGMEMRIRSLFDQCENSSERDCISSLTAIKPNGERLTATQKLVLQSKHVFKGDSKRFIPDGGGAGIWTIQDGSKTLDFAMVAGVEMRIRDLDPSSTAPIESNVVREKMLVSIQPVEIIESREIREVALSIEDGTLVGNSSAISNGCYVAANGLCALRKAFDEELSFEVGVRYLRGVQGWMVGRIQNFRLVGTPFPNNNGFEMKISGKPVTIGSVVAWSRWENTSDKIRELFAKGVDGYGWRPNKTVPEVLNPDGNTRTLLTYLNESGERSIAHFNAWLPLIKDKATAMRTRWNLQSISENQSEYERCSKGLGLIGIVNSNASVYSAGPPIFNRKAGTLEYKVAAPHYRSDGVTKHLGTYDLAMRADVARCLYGFSKAPISAVVSIESETGITSISTKTVTERDGLLRLNASGFTFSSPTIKVKLTQKSSKSQTINCKKGSKKITLTGINVECPKGYTRI